MPTLAEIEQAVAPRVGPYRRVGETTPTPLGGGFSTNAIRSSIDRGDITEGLYVLRRTAFDQDDRVRQVRDYDASSGTLTVDRAYNVDPNPAESIEFHHLHPDDELRPAVLAGLWRCYFIDAITLPALASVASERDLTAEVPWLNDPSAILGVYGESLALTQVPHALYGWSALQRGGSVWLSALRMPRALRLMVRRPHASWVNGADSLVGPTADADVLAVPLEYAAAAGHIGAWQLWQDRLADAATEGRRLTREAAARVFTEQARQHYQPPPARVVPVVLRPVSRVLQGDEVVV